MTKPQKLTPERLDAIAAYVETARHSRGGAAFSDLALPDLLAHIAALEQQLFFAEIRIPELEQIAGAAIARAEAAEESLRGWQEHKDVLEARVKVLTEALEGIVELYVDLTVEKDPENNIMVMEARAALSTAKEPTT